MTARDVVVIGAPRSGTNMLRDVLTSLPGFGSWPCDEINPIWRHGNRSHPSDELRPDQATQPVRDYVIGRFERIRSQLGVERVVEKTCANSLRVGFVHAVLPDARFVLITRDGLDAAVSAMERWHADVDLRYTAAKVRFVPPGDLPYYARRFLARRLSRGAANHAPQSGWWGPRLHDSDRLLAERPLDEVALIQWQRCVAASRLALDALPSEQVHRVGYEEFVADPRSGLRALAEFLEVPGRLDATAIARVSASSVGRGRAALSPSARERLLRLAEPELSSRSDDS